jgi:uncharacterized membrane protein
MERAGMSAGKALALGAISGLRSASGPAFVGRAASRGDMDLEGTSLAFLGGPRLSKALTLAQLGELVGDKLPVTPSRTGWPPLLGRAVSGGLAGAAVFLSEGGRATTGAIIGSSAAVAAAFAGENLRALVVSASGIPDLGIAIVEDAVILVVGSRATSKAVR